MYSMHIKMKKKVNYEKVVAATFPRSCFSGANESTC